MTGEEYAKLISENKVVDLVRPYWIGGDYQKKIWADNNITVLICQRKTRDEIKLCLESLLTFYPDINILVVDGDSQDESTMYLRTKAALYPNVKIWERVAINSHGITMDEAIRQYITTEYVLLMDSDVISTRPGYIEGMLQQFKEDPKMYATGNLMLVSRINEGCAPPYDFTDVLRYAHPCCAIYHVPTYKVLRPFENHGAPCAINMIDAEKEGWHIGYYPVDMYTIHLSGASWCIPKTVWVHDQGVKIRPLVTFIIEDFNDYCNVAAQQIVDFDVIPYGKLINTHVTTHDAPAKVVNNFLYDIRFNVSGEYVCEPNGIDMKTDFIFKLQQEIIKEVKDEYNIEGVIVVKRNIWQHNNVFE